MKYKNQFIYEFPRPAVTVDAVIFRKKEMWEVLLIKRDHPPFEGYWALPGGFIDETETLEQAVERELFEETSLRGVKLTQLKAFSHPLRDPRGRTISVAFVGILENPEITVQARDDAREIGWFNLDELPDLAFDHKEIIENAIDWLEEKYSSKSFQR